MKKNKVFEETKNILKINEIEKICELNIKDEYKIILIKEIIKEWRK
jgi:hypothetical protein